MNGDLEDCPSIDEIRQLTCSLVVQRAASEGSITVKAWSNLMGARMPDELTSLFNETYAAASELSYIDVSPCEKTELNAECSTTTYEAQRATEALLAKLDGWGPYS